MCYKKVKGYYKVWLPIGKTVELGRAQNWEPRKKISTVTFTFCILYFTFSFILFECFTMNMYSR